MKNTKLEAQLKVGVKIKIGKIFANEHSWCKEGDIIELIEGYFEEDNGLYTYTSTVPSIWNEADEDFDSIYHLFGNDLDEFADNEISPSPPNTKEE